MFKKLFAFFLLSLLSFLFLSQPVFASDKVNIYFFWAKGCPHCAKEKVFLEKIKDKYPQIEILDFDLTASKENIELMEKIGKNLNADVSGVPFTVIGEHHFSGYYNDETTGGEIEKMIECAQKEDCPDLVEGLISPVTPIPDQSQEGVPKYLKLPFIGEVETKNLSLPLLTFVIALLDGFNPCAMWVLLFLISLLLGMKDRKKMWILGTAFIAASAFVYFLFMTAWLNLFLFLGVVVWVRILIGIFALGAGAYNIRSWFVNKTAACKVVSHDKRKAIFNRARSIINENNLFLAIGGMIILAFMVNMIELLCSAGLPAIYTQVLSLSNLSTWQYYAYLIFYVFIFMIDDLFIFFVAMITLKAVGVESKYYRYSKLIGGILMAIIGILMLFKPEFLMFG